MAGPWDDYKAEPTSGSSKPWEDFASTSETRSSPPEPPPKKKGPGSIFGPAEELLMSAGTGAIARPIGQIMGTAAKIGEMTGLVGEKGSGRAEQFGTDIQDALTYRPRGEEAQAMMPYLAKPGEWWGKLAHGIANVGAGQNEGPLMQSARAGMEEFYNQAPGILGAAAGSGARPIGAPPGAGLVENTARRLMKSALKPNLSEDVSGAGPRAVTTLLEEGIPVSQKGVQMGEQIVDKINAEIKGRIARSGAKIDKATAEPYVKELLDNFIKQVAPLEDMGAIRKVWEELDQHPLLPKDTPAVPESTVDTGVLDASGKPITRTVPGQPGVKAEGIPVQQAQELKQGTYRAIGKRAYGERKGARVEAEKTLARWLKDEIADAVPEVKPLNARESKLLEALPMAERRVLREANNNPLGFGIFAAHPGRLALWMADRSGAFKSLVAQWLYRSRGVKIPELPGRAIGGSALTQGATQADQIPPPP